MCERGIDALVPSYLAARNVGIHTLTTFELWLEGPISGADTTIIFSAKPVDASASIRNKIIRLGMARAWIDDFLERLIIYPDQPTRAVPAQPAGVRIRRSWSTGCPALTPESGVVLPESEKVARDLLGPNQPGGGAMRRLAAGGGLP